MLIDGLRVRLGFVRHFELERLKFGSLYISRTARSILMILLFIWGIPSQQVWCRHKIWYLSVTLFIILIFINKKYSYKLYFSLNNIITIFSLIFHFFCTIQRILLQKIHDLSIKHAVNFRIDLSTFFNGIG